MRLHPTALMYITLLLIGLMLLVALMFLPDKRDAEADIQGSSTAAVYLNLSPFV